MSITQSMKHNARAWANDALEMLGHPDLNVCIEFNKRFTSKMGDACYMTPVGPRIRLSAPMWPLIPAAERRDTVIHEVCHIVVAHEAKGKIGKKRPKSHGIEWKSKMRACGLEPRRCHEFDTSKAPGSRRKKKIYCACDDPHSVTANMYNKVLAGARRRCKKCRQTCTVEPQISLPPKARVKSVRREKSYAERLAESLRKALEK